MLAIRMQRVGRSGHAEFRVVVQESRRAPSSGRIVAQIGHYNPHTKSVVLNKEKATFYLTNGAQPSPRAARMLKAEGVKLPDWVKIDTGKKRSVKNADKLRRNQPAKPAEPVADVQPESVTEEAAPAETAEAEEVVAA